MNRFKPVAGWSVLCLVLAIGLQEVSQLLVAQSLTLRNGYLFFS